MLLLTVTVTVTVTAVAVTVSSNSNSSSYSLRHGLPLPSLILAGGEITMCTVRQHDFERIDKSNN